VAEAVGVSQENAQAATAARQEGHRLGDFCGSRLRDAMTWPYTGSQKLP